MEILKTLSDLKKFHQYTSSDEKVLRGLIPTMGALHEGHLSLVKAAQNKCAQVMVSVFVNPIQFDQGHDLERYPRDPERDIALLRDTGCSAVWFPETDVMYPADFATRIEVGGPALHWEGAQRPGHFSGVATVVGRLFGLAKPDYAFFGEKDWQQLQVVRRMVIDLALPIQVEAVPIMREEDGLAMSSRNRFLTGEERKVAPVLFQNLLHARDRFRKKENVSFVLENTISSLEQAGFSVDYLAVVDGFSLIPQKVWTRSSRLICAAQLGSVRLLDNIGES